MRSASWSILRPATLLSITLLAIGCSVYDSPVELQRQSLLEFADDGVTLIRDDLTGVDVFVASAVINASGGELTVGGHSITVPPGAVNRPTTFTMAVIASGFLEVELTATVLTANGTVLDVGGRGFAKPVRLALSYARGTGLPSDLDNLLIVRLNPLGTATALGHEELESKVDLRRKTVSADLEHFSGYAMAAD